MSRRITVVTEHNDDLDGFNRYEYPGVLVDAKHAFYIDAEYNTVVLERVSCVNGEYHTTGGPSSIGFDLPVDDVTFFDRITEMSAVELLAALVKHSTDN